MSEEKKDPNSFVMTVRKATTYIVDKDGNEIEQSSTASPPAGEDEGERDKEE